MSRPMSYARRPSSAGLRPPWNVGPTSVDETRGDKPSRPMCAHEVWRRDGGRCVSCGSAENLEFDHIIPVAMGGASTTRNLQLLCGSCNGAKGGELV